MLQKWIDYYSSKFFQKGTPTALTKNTISIITRLVTISMKAADSVTQECQDHFKITEWFERFHSALSENGELKIK